MSKLAFIFNFINNLLNLLLFKLLEFNKKDNSLPTLPHIVMKKEENTLSHIVMKPEENTLSHIVMKPEENNDYNGWGQFVEL